MNVPGPFFQKNENHLADQWSFQVRSERDQFLRHGEDSGLSPGSYGAVFLGLASPKCLLQVPLMSGMSDTAKPAWGNVIRNSDAKATISLLILASFLILYGHAANKLPCMIRLLKDIVSSGAS